MSCSMARRVLILLCGAGAGLCPLLSYALGLGDLEVESRLNQPLRARIEVAGVSDDEWRRLGAHLSWQQSTADGLSRPGLLESVTFKNVEDENHRRFIEVKSAEPFTEPLFDLSIAVTGIDADVTRNYTVFLDPPGPNDDLPGTRGPMLASQTAAPAHPGAGLVTRRSAATAGVASRGAASVRAESATGAVSTRREPGRMVHPPRQRAMAARASFGDASAPPPASAVSGSATALAPASTASGGAAAMTAASAASGLAGRAPARVAADSISSGSYTVTKADTLGKIARRFGGATAASRNHFMDWVFQHNPAAFYGDMNRLRAGARLALPESAATAGARTAAAEANVVSDSPPGAGARAKSSTAVAGAQSTDGPAETPAQKAQLQGELASLEQELTALQRMVAQQDAQIAALKQQIAAREEAERTEQQRVAPTSQARAPDDQAAAAAAAAKSTAALAHADQNATSPFQEEAGRAIVDSDEPRTHAASPGAQTQSPAFESQSPAPAPAESHAPSSGQTSDNPGASRPGIAGLWARYRVKSSVYYRVAGIVSLGALMVLLLFYIRRRMEEANPDVELRYPIGPTFERSTEAPGARASVAQALPVVRSSGSGSAAAKLSAALKRREPDDTSDTESVSGHAEALEEPRTGLDTWRAQTALLEQDMLSETDVLPFVLDTQNQMKAVDEDLLSPSELTHESREFVSDGDFARELREEDFADTATSIPTEQLPGMAAEDLAELAAREQAELEQAARDMRAATGKGASAPDRVANDAGSKDMTANDATARMVAQPDGARDDALLENVSELPPERSATHQDIVKALESSLDYQPDRVDIQLKLLEIYHHEALGNRENFHTMLRKLSDRKNLSPAQRLHVEMLQRTLQDGDSSFVAEEEM